LAHCRRNSAVTRRQGSSVSPLLSFICHALIVTGLTLLTQIGGLAYLIALLATKRWRSTEASRWLRAVYLATATLLIYAAASIVVVPPLAGLFGRERVPCTSTTFAGCVLNRIYVKPKTVALIAELDRAVASRFPSSNVTVLEGSFPFVDGFPLPPHLSHHDGRKVDFAFFYRDASGRPVARGSPSPIGYFHFQQPRPADREPCAGRFTPLRWDFAWLQPREPAWALDEERTRAMILWLKAHPDVKRIFIEPHLADRLDVGGGKVRFQGCQAARHDDHLHVEVR
jgi:hypothetical protein